MNAPDLAEELEQRFDPLMRVAQLRLSANNLEMWEHQGQVNAWSLMDMLAALPDDPAAADWLLLRCRAQEMMCVVLGYGKLRQRLERSDAKALRFAEAANDTLCLSEAFRLFALYWFNLPIGYWRAANVTGCV